MIKRQHTILLIIVLVATLLRFINLGSIPYGFHRDEAFLGYNAYSILKTGKSISGDFLPVHLPSFLYSPAGYSYFSIPFIAIFGLSEFSVRLPSAFFGTLTVLVTYFLVKELFGKARNKDIGQIASCLPLISAGLLSISPWHINLSRTATENTVATFFIVFGVLLYFQWLRSLRLITLIVAFLAFGIAIFTYQAPRAFLPLFVPFLVLLFPPNRRQDRIIAAVGYAVVVILPLAVIMLSPNLSLRIRTVSIFASPEVKLVVEEQLREDGVRGIPPLVARVFHNKLVAYAYAMLDNYFAHFSYSFLFTDRGFPVRYRVPSSGLLYIVSLPFVVAGMWFIFKRDRRAALFLLGWILLSPIGSALTSDDVPNMQRTLFMLPAFSILTAYGIMSAVKKAEHLRFKYIYYAIFTAIAVYSTASYIFNYHINQIVHQPLYRHEGYKELVGKVNELLPNYSGAVITNQESAPAIFFLFFGVYDPRIFQQETKDKKITDYDRASFGPYIFSQETCPLQETSEGQLAGKSGILYVNHATCEAPIFGAKQIAEINRPDNTTIFRIMEVSDEKIIQ